jgi:hypothetical protein
MDTILKVLIPLSQQGRAARFLSSTEDVDKLSGVVEDIHDAMMEYQVRPWSANPHLA